jgi:hypothetical protein
MTSNKTFPFILLVLLWTSCKTHPKVREEDKIFHAGPVQSGFGGIFFELYKENKYKFCDGDFMNPGCYTGFYSLSGDTIILKELKKHDGIPTNRFIIRRYFDMDSNYWQWKYPRHKNSWQFMRHNDFLMGSTGDVFPLDQEGKIVFDRNNYFLIRLDSLKNNR